MNARTTLIASALILTAPVLSHAGQDVAMDACVKAFVNASLEKERPYTVRTEESTYTPVDLQARAFRIELKATGKDSGKNFGKAVCVVDRNGEVLSFNGKAYKSEELLSAR